MLEGKMRKLSVAGLAANRPREVMGTSAVPLRAARRLTAGFDLCPFSPRQHHRPSDRRTSWSELAPDLGVAVLLHDPVDGLGEDRVLLGRLLGHAVLLGDLGRRAIQGATLTP
jgi:hypothetical protein